MTTFTPPSIEELQEKFKQYEVESFIAQGGMGAVYLARQISLDRPVAIKILPQEFGEDKDYRVSFETEAKAMAKLNHSNLVGIYDFGEINGMLYIVMEYIPGRSLFDSAHGQKVDQLEAARLIADMSDGLEHAHSAGLLHRDIKPANVLIDDEARPKIVDFGLAKPTDETQTEGVVFGTPGYTAPEVLSNPFDVDHRSDIFSMGVMLYELLTGQLPGEPLLAASSISKSDERFDSIITKALHADPAMRYASAGELSKDLGDLIENFDTPVVESKPVVKPSVSPLLVSSSAAGAARPLMGNRVAPMVVTKKSNGGAVFVVLLLLAVGGFFGYKAMSDSGPQKPTEAELAKQAAAEKRKKEKAKEKELQRIATEKEALKMKKERERILAEREKSEREEEKERREAEREARIEERLLERERIRKEEMAAKAKAEKEEEDASLDSNFDLEKFLKKTQSGSRLELALTETEKKKILSPLFDKLERKLERITRSWFKGKRGRELKEKVEKYMEEVRETHEIEEITIGFKEDIKIEVEGVLDEYREEMEEEISKVEKKKELVRLKYLQVLSVEQMRLAKIKDQDAADSLDEPIEDADSLEDFLSLFEKE